MKILVGISGGLDSAYAALKLQREGHEVEGAVLVMHDYTDVSGAEQVAREVGIKLHVLDCRNEFSAVTSNFVDEYCNGRTPNPCIICNPLVKFKKLYDYAMENGFDMIATGHYARLTSFGEGAEKRYTLQRSADSKKDQTYMLYRLPQHILSKLYFPLMQDKKSEVRSNAEAEGLSVADKKESQEICFISDGDYAAYIEEKRGVFPEGDFVDDKGNVIGRHKGIIRYTMGQRKGLGVAAGGRIFVTDIDAEKNVITLSKDGAFTDEVKISDIVYSGLSPVGAGVNLRVSVKLRYLATAVGATAIFDGNGNATLKLDEPQKAVTPGQSAVMYDGDILLCGGFINK